MPLPKRYKPDESEPRLQAIWREHGTHQFNPQSKAPIYSIDTPPPTVSGLLHLGHVYSYTHTDLIARYRRMKGENVFYPMGFDDNGLPTERLVEREFGIAATEVDRHTFIQKCMQFSHHAEQDYQALWQRMGLSIDWRYTYRTIDDQAQRIVQLSFLQLYNQGLVYRERAPAIWCPECRTSIAQAELDDLDRESEFYTLAFSLEDGESLPIATTRPELLSACVAIFVHPHDERYKNLAGRYATVPLYKQQVPILQDHAADPEKGTGAVMCCTFGDTTDKEWWVKYNLPVVEAIAPDGTLTQAADAFAGLPVKLARQKIVLTLEEQDLVEARMPTTQSIRVHERCDTPVEYIMIQQWFIQVLDFKDQLLEAGEEVNWYPAHMKDRYRSWVENLAWDWCISRQRYIGPRIPVWYCKSCGEMKLPEEDQLPVNPSETHPNTFCQCGSEDFIPEEDVFDTWATSSMSPQIVSRWLEDPVLYKQLFPMSLRAQAHEIIRTWAFYTIYKSHFHFNEIPWKDVAISGWGIAGKGMGKISKSRGGGSMSPMKMIERYSADAVRYWTASTGPGKDAIISEEKIQMGIKLVNKLWNVARFSERFLEGYHPSSMIDDGEHSVLEMLTPADRWILSRLQHLILRVTDLFENYDYAAVKSELENFFWSEFADNYLEMCKQRLYNASEEVRAAALFSLYLLVESIIKLFAPFLPHVTEEIFQGLFTSSENFQSIHTSPWPGANPDLLDDRAEQAGMILVDIATSVRRYKSDHNLPLSTPLEQLQLATTIPDFSSLLQAASDDLESITRAQSVVVVTQIDPSMKIIHTDGDVHAGISILEE
jgi:valyl-tRNA synthetase